MFYLCFVLDSNLFVTFSILLVVIVIATIANLILSSFRYNSYKKNEIILFELNNQSIKLSERLYATIEKTTDLSVILQAIRDTTYENKLDILSLTKRLSAVENQFNKFEEKLTFIISHRV